MRKRRILLTNEFSLLSSGYAVYGKELLSRLHGCGLYEVAELACYLADGDPRRDAVPWRVYPNAPAPSDRAQAEKYHARVANQFGEYRFNAVCLDFRPDVVLDIRDPWMYAFIERSPYRDLFHWVQMPTVDSAPYKEQWLATLAGCDRVLTYNDWSRRVLEQEGGGLIDVCGVAPSGADFANFPFHDQKAMRSHFNLEDDVNIVGTVMRNQVRKLYPQLIRDFASLIDSLDPATAARTYLYLHTSYPDLGWDLPRLIKQSGVSHKILLTYKCKDCLAIFPSFYADASTLCPGCRSPRCSLPNVSNGVDHATLGKIMATFDVYVQYATAEGLGMPQIEAAASGVPVMSVDYSAMSDVVRKLGGRPIKVASLEMDNDVGSYRARPDGRDFVKGVKAFLRLDPARRAEQRARTRKAVETHYTWDLAVQTWRDAIDGLPLRPQAETWDRPSRLHTPREGVPEGLSPTEAVRWAIRHVLGRPDLVDSYLALRMIRDLNWGVRLGDKGRHYQNEESMLGGSIQSTPYGVPDMLAELRDMCEFNNMWETRRMQHVGKEQA